MPALDPKDYAELVRVLEELAPEIEDMKEAPRNFMRDMIQRNKEYGERLFVSPKQLSWVKQLHEEYVGDTVHDRDPEGDGRHPPRDMDDDIPF